MPETTTSLFDDLAPTATTPPDAWRVGRGMPAHVVLQWPRLSPYHLARLRALATRLNAHGGRLTALETAGRDTSYAWDTPAGDEPFARVTVFPDDAFEALSYRTIQDGVTRALDALAPDAVGVNSYVLPDALASLRWCRDHRRVAVCMTDSKADDAPRVFWKEAIKRRIAQQFDAAFVAGSASFDYLTRSLGLHADRVTLGFDVVDNDAFAPAVAARAQRHATAAASGLTSPPVLLCVARLISRKNVDGLLRGAAPLLRAHGWRLAIAGDGPQRDALAREADRLGLSETVDWVGRVTYDELPALYARADAFVLPSHRDQWGLVVNEAMAAGLPVLVSTRAGCAPDLVEEGVTGWTFDPARAASLPAALTHLVGTSRETRTRMGEASLQRIADWSPPTSADAFLRAAAAGGAASHRPLAPDVRLALALMRRLARRAQAFHVP